MKRSELIEKLADLLETSFDGDNGSWYEDAEKALNMLEKEGMLPPGRKGEQWGNIYWVDCYWDENNPNKLEYEDEEK